MRDALVLLSARHFITDGKDICDICLQIANTTENHHKGLMVKSEKSVMLKPPHLKFASTYPKHCLWRNVFLPLVKQPFWKPPLLSNHRAELTIVYVMR